MLLLRVSVPQETGEPKGVIAVYRSLVGIDGVNEKLVISNKNYEERFLETAHSGGYHHPDGHRNQPRNGLLHGLIVIAIWLMCVG